MTLPVFLTAKEVTKKFKLSAAEIGELEVVGHYFPPTGKSHIRSTGVELYRAADVQELAVRNRP